MNYSWIIGIVSGTVVDALIQIITLSVLNVDYSVLWMILGHVFAILIGFVLHLFVFSVDYSATEYLQFEDDDYYYYVKAIPKVSVTNKNVTVKKINSHVEKGIVHTENFDENIEEVEF